MSSADYQLYGDFLQAAKHGDLNILQRTLACGADAKKADDFKMTALHWSAYSGLADCVAVLLPYSDPFLQDRDGHTPLHLSAHTGSAQCVKLLLPVSDPYLPDKNGLTALHWAAANGNFDCLQLLYPCSDPSLMDVYGRTPLIAAAQNGQYDCLLRLLASATPQIALDQSTARYCAQQNSHLNCVQLIDSFIHSRTEHVILEQSSRHAPPPRQRSAL